ncbi:hypothetical protein JCM15415_12290 [Methanobacterium movens]|nr:MAG: hypothetical protein CIT03_09215 [Methanobacterium sp.]
MVPGSAPITFKRKIDGEIKDLTVSEEFVMDFHFTTQEHLMVILRVMGRDSQKTKDFFKDTINETFQLKTMDTWKKEKVEDEFTLTDMYLDEGPPLSIDIGVDPYMVRIILDFKKTN